MTTKTQAGAIAFVSIVLVWIIGHYVVALLQMASRSKQIAAQGRFPVPLWRWRCWPTGVVLAVDAVQGRPLTVTRENPDLSVCCTCPGLNWETHLVQFGGGGNTMHSVARQALTCAAVGLNFLMAAVLSMWLHFTPCFDWSCDWGENDKEGIRGAIWFASWVGITLLLSLPWFRPMELTLREPMDSHRTANIPLTQQLQRDGFTERIAAVLETPQHDDRAAAALSAHV